jgi:transposase-like protein
MAGKLEEALYARNMPCSGSVAIDEVHLKLEGEKGYLQTALDNHFRLIMRGDFCRKVNKDAIVSHVNSMRLGQNLKLTSVVHDGLKAYGSAFKYRGMTNMKQGTCRMHYKQLIRGDVNKAIGRSKTSRKSLPRKIARFLFIIYKCIEASTTFRFISLIEAARSLASTLQNEKLNLIVKKVESARSLLQAHLKHDFLAKSTSPLESFHHEIEVYPYFKKGRKKDNGVMLVANARAYVHNMRELQAVIPLLREEKRFWDKRQEIFGYNSRVRSAKIRLGHMMAKVNEYSASLQGLWNQYLVPETLELFKKLWGHNP